MSRPQAKEDSCTRRPRGPAPPSSERTPDIYKSSHSITHASFHNPSETLATKSFTRVLNLPSSTAPYSFIRWLYWKPTSLLPLGPSSTIRNLLDSLVYMIKNLVGPSETLFFLLYSPTVAPLLTVIFLQRYIRITKHSTEQLSCVLRTVSARWRQWLQYMFPQSKTMMTTLAMIMRWVGMYSSWRMQVSAREARVWAISFWSYRLEIRQGIR